MNKKWKIVLWVFIILTLIIGGFSVYDRLSNGHINTGYGSYITWGLWVAMYIYFISLSAGAFLISALVYVFGLKVLEPIGRLALFTALISLVASILHIWFDLGHLERFWHVYASPNWGSLLNFMVWSYSAYFLVLLTEFFLVMKKPVMEMLNRPYAPEKAIQDMRNLKKVASFGLVLAVAFHGGVGAVFGVLVARPFWHVGLYPILFLIAALASGAAFITFLVAFITPGHLDRRNLVNFLGRLTLVLLVFEAIYLFADFFISLYQAAPANKLAVEAVLLGPYSWAFWTIQIFIGTLVPIVLLSLKRFSSNIKLVGVAGLMVVIGFFVARLNLILPGMVIPELEGIQNAFVSSTLSFDYFPTLVEWGLTIGVTGFGLLLFVLGYQRLPLFDRQ